MSEIVQELRERADSFSNHIYAAELHARAADKIERLHTALNSVLDALGALSNPNELHGLMGITEAEEVFDALKET